MANSGSASTGSAFGEPVESLLDGPEPAWFRTIEKISNGGASVAGVAIVLLAAVVVFDVASRNLFNRPIPGVLDMVTYWWMPLIGLLALGAVELRREHISVTLLSDRAGPGARRIIEIFTSATTFTAAVWMGYLSLERAIVSVATQEAAVGTTRWVLIWPIRILVVAALALFAVAALARLIRAAQGRREER